MAGGGTSDVEARKNSERGVPDGIPMLGQGPLEPPYIDPCPPARRCPRVIGDSAHAHKLYGMPRAPPRLATLDSFISGGNPNQTVIVEMLQSWYQNFELYDDRVNLQASRS